MLDRIGLADKAIHQRVRELSQEGDGSAVERTQIGDVRMNLRLLKVGATGVTRS